MWKSNGQPLGKEQWHQLEGAARREEEYQFSRRQYRDDKLNIRHYYFQWIVRTMQEIAEDMSLMIQLEFMSLTKTMKPLSRNVHMYINENFASHFRGSQSHSQKLWSIEDRSTDWRVCTIIHCFWLPGTHPSWFLYFLCDHEFPIYSTVYYGPYPIIGY